MEKDIFNEMANKWPSAVVARTEIEKFSGGLITPKSIANLDSLGKGIEGRIHVGRKVAYPIDELVGWLRDRAN